MENLSTNISTGKRKLIATSFILALLLFGVGVATSIIAFIHLGNSLIGFLIASLGAFVSGTASIIYGLFNIIFPDIKTDNDYTTTENEIREDNPSLYKKLRIISAILFAIGFVLLVVGLIIGFVNY